MERSPAEVSMRRHSPQPADRELSSETTRFSRTTESYRARKRQLEKKPGSIWSVTSRSSPAVPIFCLCVYTTSSSAAALICSAHSLGSVSCTAPESVRRTRKVFGMRLAKRLCSSARRSLGALSLFLKEGTL